MKRVQKKQTVKVVTDIRCKSCGKDHAGGQGYCTDCLASGGKKKGEEK